MHPIFKRGFAALSLATAAVVAQAAGFGHHGEGPPPQQHQQARIAHGVADGSLTPREARQLQRQQRQLRQAERQARADGVVTRAERRHLAQLRRQIDRDIHQQRHDTQVRRHD